MQPALILIIFCFLFASVMLAVTAGMRVLEKQRKQRVQDILRTTTGAPPVVETRILNESGAETQPGILDQLSELPVLRRLQANIYQAGMDWPVMKLLGAMVASAAGGLLLAVILPVPFFREAAVGALAFVFGALPYLVVMRKRRNRLRAFENEFPESLDFLARSLRAGHAFTMGLEMMADESPDPIGSEFRRLFNEHNLGAPIDVAMRNFAERVPLLDVKFFVSAILLQRETGGNLAEILMKLAYVIRERFRLKGQVRAASAHGRITAAILTVLPIITGIGLTIVSPGYLKSMANDPLGRWIFVVAIIAQIFGYLVMKRIVNIKV